MQATFLSENSFNLWIFVGDMDCSLWCVRIFLFTMAQQPYWAKAPLSRIHDHTQTHHTREDSSGRVTSPTQRPVPNNTQHSQQTDIHAPGGIQTRNPSKRAAANPRLRPCGHWDQRMCVCVCVCVHTHNVDNIGYILYNFKSLISVVI